MSYLAAFDGLLWLLAAALVLIFLQRSLHREIQAFFLIISRRPGFTQAVFAMLFFPGVFLHESSHFLAAKLLGLETGRFSLIPQAQPGGKLRLGYVETASGGFIRDALIGVAPLVTGCLLVGVIGIYLLHLLPLWDLLLQSNWSAFWAGLSAVPKAPDFWLWFYLAFTVSSTMMPSASDRHAWLPLALLALGLLAVAILAGAGPWMMQHLAAPFNSFLRALALIFFLSSLFHLILILPFLALHLVLAKVSGVDIER